MSQDLPLSGLKVLDFTTLLPGPLATLMLAECGATVLKVERPPHGDPGRRRAARLGEPIEFALINNGKSSLMLDLKAPEGLDVARRLAAQADILVEQFRPGVMNRLGLGYDGLCKLNPRLIYCALTGYGQTGPLANRAGHDINYSARSGMLSQSVDSDGVPVLPQGQLADVGGGTLPAVINILLALRSRERTGEGAYIDIAMAENTFAWMRNALAPVFAGDAPLSPGGHSHTGASARYGIYLSADRRAFAVAALEEPFWLRFCEIIGIDPDAERDQTKLRAVLQKKMSEKTAAEWTAAFFGEDVCVELVQDPAEAFKDPHFAARGVFARKMQLLSGREIPSLPLPISPRFLKQESDGYPALGSAHVASAPGWEI